MGICDQRAKSMCKKLFKNIEIKYLNGKMPVSADSGQTSLDYMRFEFDFGGKKKFS